jgi:tRNA U34 5-carboxymethylaminomethyl modifying GTPase MnmE/TrmE
VSSTLELLRLAGFALVETGLDETGLDLLDGETILDHEINAALPLARTEPAVRMLLAQPQAWNTFLASEPTAQQVSAVLADRCLWNLLHLPRVAIVGPPNVGKSTLANQLFGQERVITADHPGTTRDWVGEIANIDGLAVVLVDTPGLRHTSDPIEAEAIRRAGHVIESSELIIAVSDPSMPFPAAAANSLRVLNKADLLDGKMAIEPEVCLTVATSGQGVDALRDRIRAFFGCADLARVRAMCWSDRQRASLQRDPRDVLVGHQ